MKTLKHLLCLGWAGGFSGTAVAGTFTFVTPGASVDTAGESVSAAVTFTTGAGTLSISLTNLTVNPTSVGQNLSDLFFTLSNSALTSGTVGTDGPDQLVNVSATAPHAPISDATRVSGWACSFNAVTGFHLDGLGGTFTPARTILGAPDASGN